ncbi:MAG: glycosyltransferase [Candidatus Omnitrophota bacterium]|jgi:glycosyltransferase involved in cell wall biosynthesis
MKISIVIPTLNRRERLLNVFEDLKKQSYGDFEVVILDGGSKDATEELCNSYKKYFDVRFYLQKKPGIVAAMNEALEYCTGDIFTRTDDDVEIPPDWLKEITAVFSRFPDAGGATGPTIIPAEKLDNRDLTLFNKKISEPRNIFWKIFKAVYHDYFMEGEPFAVSRFYRCGAFSLGSNYELSRELKDTIAVDYLESCNWSVKLELIRRIGGFDQRYGGLSEYFEADAVYRVKRLGFKMYFNPRAGIRHLVDKGGNFKARSGTFGRANNFILFYLKNIKPDTLDKAFRFLSYLLFINSYFVYCFIRGRNFRQLTGIPGTLAGLIRYFPEIYKR